MLLDNRLFFELEQTTQPLLSEGITRNYDELMRVLAADYQSIPHIDSFGTFSNIMMMRGKYQGIVTLLFFDVL